MTYIERSLEEQIVVQLWEVGPVVAIGQPGLETDPIGAARERTVGPLWQPRVQTLIEESGLVVVVLGQTEGLFLEYEQLSRHRVSVLAILPPSGADVLADRWQRFTAAFRPPGASSWKSRPSFRSWSGSARTTSRCSCQASRATDGATS